MKTLETGLRLCRSGTRRHSCNLAPTEELSLSNGPGTASVPPQRRRRPDRDRIPRARGPGRGARPL